MKKFLFLLLILILANTSFGLIRDNNIEWRSARMYIPASQMTSLVAQDGVDTGSTTIEEISSFGFTGLTMAATTDAASTLVMLPRNLDVTQPVYVRVLYTITGTPTGTEEVTWTAQYRQTALNVVMAAAGTALDTAIAADLSVVTSAYALIASPWGVISANQLIEGRALGLRIALTSADYAICAPATKPIALMGIELEYTPRNCAVLPYGFEASRE